MNPHHVPDLERYITHSNSLCQFCARELRAIDDVWNPPSSTHRSLPGTSTLGGRRPARSLDEIWCQMVSECFRRNCTIYPENAAQTLHRVGRWLHFRCFVLRAAPRSSRSRCDEGLPAAPTFARSSLSEALWATGSFQAAFLWSILTSDRTPCHGKA